MTEKQLREAIRKEIRSQISEADTDFLTKIGSNLRSKLGSAKTQLNVGLGKIDPKRIANMTPEQKAELTAQLTQQLGLTAKDFNTIKQRIARKLGAAEKLTTTESIINELDMDTPEPESKVSSGLSQRTERVKDTVAFKQMVKMLENKPATEQANFVLELLQGLPLDDAAKRMLRMRIKTQLK
jgi:hypothetical protein